MSVTKMFGAEAFPRVDTSTDLFTQSVSANVASGNNYQNMTSANVSPLVDLKETFIEMAYDIKSIARNTFETSELLATAVLGTPGQQRDEDIGAGDTDTDKPKDKPKGFVDRLKGLNPFKEGLGTNIPTFLLALAAFLGLKLFGDKLIPSIAKFLESIKQGKIGEKIEEIYTDIKEILIPFWADIKVKVGEFIEGVKIVFGLVMGAADAVKKFISQYDTQGAGPGNMNPDGKLDEYEQGKMIEDVTTKISEGIFGFASSLAGTILQAFTIYAVGSTALKLLAGAGIKAAIAGGALSLGGALTIAGAVLALGTVIALGAFKLQDNIATAYEDATTDALGQPQDFAPKEFITRLLVGKETGNKIKDVLQNAYDKMFIGAATGAAIGGVAGAGVFSIPAAGFGAVIGALSGITIGALSAYYGDEAINKVIDDMVGEESPLGMIASYITNMYKRLILAPFEFIFGKLGTEGDSLFSKMQMKLGNPSGSNERKIYNDEELYGENVNSDKVSRLSDDELINIKKNNVAELENLDKTSGISIFGYNLKEAGYMDTHSSRKVLMTLDVINAEIQKRGLINAPDFLQTGQLGNDNNIQVMPKVNTLMEEVKKRELGREIDTIIANNNNVNDNSTKVVEGDNIINSGLNVSNPNPNLPFLNIKNGR